MNTPIQLRDLIYFDLKKANSLYSQFASGLVTQVLHTAGNRTSLRTNQSGSQSADRSDSESVTQEEESGLEVKLLHHDMLIQLENLLEDQSLLLDLHNIDTANLDDTQIQACIANSGKLYIRAEGYLRFEDFNGLVAMIDSYPSLMAYLSRQGTPPERIAELESLVQMLEKRRQAVSEEKHRDRKAMLKLDLERMEREAAERIASISGTSAVPPDWQLSGIKLFIELFQQKRMQVRLSPFGEQHTVQFIANLKRECFVDDDLDSIMFAYGVEPNVKFTVFGLITSIPTDSGRSDTSLRWLDRGPMTKAFNGIFEFFRQMEAYSRADQYPNFTVYPIALYRAIR